MLYLILAIFVVQAVSGTILNNQDNNQWYKDGVKLIRDNLRVRPNKKTAKSAIIFVGDGMGITTVTAARILDGQMKGGSGEENVLSWEEFPWSGQVKTYCVDQQGADSAASATAFLNGIKTNDGVLGMDERVKRGYCSTASANRRAISILSLAEMAGMSTGIVTTTRVTHATPASAYAYSADRGWESDDDKLDEALDDASACKDIALQLVEYPYGDGIEVIFGGGRREFMRQNQADPEYPDRKGKRLDGRDLIQEWVDKHPNSQYVWNKAGFDQIDTRRVDHVMGLFERSHMKYEVDRAEDPAGEPSIAEMTEKAIQILRKNPKGFFLLVEAGRIDHGHHGGRAFRALHDTLALDKAVSKALRMINRAETLIAVSADHSHVFTIGAYPQRGNPIFDIVREVGGKLAVGSDNKTYTSLGYANGRGGLQGPRPDLRGVNTTHKDYRQQATVRRRSETHGTEDVGVYADGPGAYLFHGVFEQQYVFHVMDHALCLSDSKQKSCKKHKKRKGKSSQRRRKIPSVRRVLYRRGRLG
ncbi:alkaline phosphatase-like isoform X2 [Oculina patagonica]